MFTSHLWTVSLEEQAYLVLPLALSAFIAKNVSIRFVVGLTMAVLTVLILSRLSFVLAGTAHPFIWTLPLRADSFVLGSAAAIAVHRGALVPKRWMIIAGSVLIGCVGLFSSIDEPGSYQIIGYSVIALGAVLLVVGAQAPGVERSPLAWRPMRYLGKISYGFYVYHVLAIDVALGRGHWLGVTDQAAVPLALALNISMAALSYAIFEKPFLRWNPKFEVVAARPI